MSIRGIYTGTLPDRPDEREALLTLCNQIEPLEDWFVLMLRFSLLSGRAPDLIVVKSDCVFVIDLKYCGEALVSGQINGPWILKDIAGNNLGRLNEDRTLNPYQQVNQYWYELREFLEKNATKFFKPVNAGRFQVKARPPIRSALVFSPRLNPGSNVPQDYKCPSISLNEAARFLWREHDASLYLTADEAIAMAKFLNLHEWKDVSSLLMESQNNSDLDFDNYRSRILNEQPRDWLAPQILLVGTGTSTERQQQISLIDAIADVSHLLVFGRAGLGKSVQLRRLRDEMAGRKDLPAPVLVRACIYDPEKSGFAELIKDELVFHGLAIKKADIESLLREGLIALLVDGLNEIPERYRDSWNREIGRYLANLTHTVVVMTARHPSDLGYRDGSIRMAELMPLSDAALNDFVTNRGQSLTNLEKVHQRFKELLHFPLYADLVCKLWQTGYEVDTTSLGGLVGAAATCILNREQSVPALAPPQILQAEVDKLLAELGSTMHEEMVIALPRHDVIDCLRRSWTRLKGEGRISLPEDLVVTSLLKSPLLMEVGSTNIAFAHQVFQEHFAGVWLRDLLKDNVVKNKGRLAQAWWTEPCIHAFGMLRLNSDLLGVLFQSRNKELIGHCLAGECGSEFESACDVEIKRLLSDDDDEQRAFAVECVARSGCGSKEVTMLLRVISDEEARVLEQFPNIKLNELEYLYSEPLTRAWKAAKFAFPDNSKISNDSLPSLLDIANLHTCARIVALRWIRPAMYMNQKLSDQIVALIENQLNQPSPTLQYTATHVLTGMVMVGLHQQYPEILRILHQITKTGKGFAPQEAFECLHGIGEVNIDEWITGETQRLLEAAESALAGGDLSIVDVLAGNYFDEIMGEAICQAESALGEKAFEQLFIRRFSQCCLEDIVNAKPTDERETLDLISALVGRAVIAEHLGRIGSLDAVQPLSKDVTSHCPPGLDSRVEMCFLECRVAALSALASIRNQKSKDALTAIATRGECWDCRLLGLVGLDIARSICKREGTDSTVADTTEGIMAVCDLAGTETVLGFLIDIKWALGSRPSFPMWDPCNFVRGIPISEIRKASVSLLQGPWQKQEFAILLLAEYGTDQDLSLLRTKLENERLVSQVHSAILRIQSRG